MTLKYNFVVVLINETPIATQWTPQKNLEIKSRVMQRMTTKTILRLLANLIDWRTGSNNVFSQTVFNRKQVTLAELVKAPDSRVILSELARFWVFWSTTVGVGSNPTGDNNFLFSFFINFLIKEMKKLTGAVQRAWVGSWNTCENEILSYFLS